MSDHKEEEPATGLQWRSLESEANASTCAASGAEPDPEEEITEGNWATPQVEVKQVSVVTGEEGEEIYWKHRAKLYRWHKEENVGEWKERGIGEAKLLEHKETGKIRFLLRQEKTLKVVANHYVLRMDNYCQLVPNVGSDKIWVWTVNDHAEEAKLQQFALKFGKVDDAKAFKEHFEDAARINSSLFQIPTRGTPTASASEGPTPKAQAKVEEVFEEAPTAEAQEAKEVAAAGDPPSAAAAEAETS